MEWKKEITVAFFDGSHCFGKALHMEARKVIGSFTYCLLLDSRLLRDSHLDLEIETLKENSHLILNLDSQFCCENSHSHSQLSFSNSRKYESPDI